MDINMDMEVKNIKKARNAIVLLLFCVCVFVQAQETQPEKQYVKIRQEALNNWDNWAYWTISVSGGGNVYFGEFDKADGTHLERFSPLGRAAVTRWFSSVWGLRGQLEGGTFCNSAQIVMLGQDDKIFSYGTASMFAVTNIMNWGRRKRSNRPVSVYLYGGIGAAIAFERESYPTKLSPTVILGAELNVRISDFWSLSLDANGVLLKDDFNSVSGGIWMEGYISASLGLAYRFFAYPVRMVK